MLQMTATLFREDAKHDPASAIPNECRMARAMGDFNWGVGEELLA
jgi:hypothetical protein